MKTKLPQKLFSLLIPVVSVLMFLPVFPSYTGAQEEETSDNSLVFLLSHQGYDGDEEDIINTIKYTEEAALLTLGTLDLQYTRTLPLEAAENSIKIDRAKLFDACIAAGTQYALALSTLFRDDRLFWRYDLYSLTQNDVLATDAFSVALIAGVSAPAVIDASLYRLSNSWHKSEAFLRFDGRAAVMEGQKYRSYQEGMEILYGDETGKSAGKIEQGTLEGELVLFPQNRKITGTAVKKGFWSEVFFLPNGITKGEKGLKSLQKHTTHSLGLNSSFRGMDNYAVDFEYRLHLAPDRFFLQADWELWRDNSVLSGGEDALHQELRLGGGLYLQPKNTWRFRFLVGSGIALLFSNKESNFQADPIWLGLEYHFPQWAITGSLRAPAALSYERDAFDKAKLGKDDFYTSIGVMMKW
ncbi:MAG: hypothetical protein LBL64_07675 [Treponema sp.]|jgi:hypothetical protein|nr:hypothetical protein [Treponema sp.]